MSRWEAGDRAMVEIVGTTPTGHVKVGYLGGEFDTLEPSGLHPLPVALAAEDAAVIEAAEAWVTRCFRSIPNANLRRGFSRQAIALVRAVRARAKAAQEGGCYVAVGDPVPREVLDEIMPGINHDARIEVTSTTIHPADPDPAPYGIDLSTEEGAQDVPQFKIGDRVRSKTKPRHGTIYKMSDKLIWVALSDAHVAIGAHDKWALASDDTPESDRQARLEEAADAVLAKTFGWKPSSVILGDGSAQLMDAVKEYRALLTPPAPDPATELREASAEVLRWIDHVATNEANPCIVNPKGEAVMRLRAALVAPITDPLRTAATALAEALDRGQKNVGPERAALAAALKGVG